MRQVSGVTYAESNKWTGNILVLFNPTVINEKDVITELTLAGETQPVVDDKTAVESEPSEANPVLVIEEKDQLEYVTGLRGRIYKALGWISVGLAVVGFALPGIPGAPFVVLAGYFFIRSSPRSHAWLRRSRWFGQILRDWEQKRAVRRSLKYTGVGLIIVAMVAILLSGLPIALIYTILVFEIVGLTIVMRLRVAEETPAPVLDPAPSLRVLTAG
jgi:uncharacterized membrane protein YbaN (DUF454 family)